MNGPTSMFSSLTCLLAARAVARDANKHGGLLNIDKGPFKKYIERKNHVITIIILILVLDIKPRVRDRSFIHGYLRATVKKHIKTYRLLSIMSRDT